MGALDRYSDRLVPCLRGAAEFRMIPPADDREAWSALGDATRASILAEADRRFKQPLPAITLDQYTDYGRAGDETSYLEAYAARRRSLRALTLATCAEPSERYLSEIARLIWAICEESAWTRPSSNALREGGALPDPARPAVDAAAASTAADLAVALRALGPMLDEISPRIRARARDEALSRAVIPFEAGEDWLLGPRADAIPCLAGILIAFLALEEEPRMRARLFRKAWRELDALLAPLSPDGGLRGGLSAWRELAGALIDCLTAAYRATDGGVDALRDPLVVKLCRFPVACHLARGHFVNSGEQSMRPGIPGLEVYRLGMASRDAYLCDLGAYLARTGGAYEQRDEDAPIHRAAFYALNRAAVERESVSQPLIRQAFLPETGLFIAREEAGSERGLAVSMRGGDNGLPGSHLDAGDVAVFLGGEAIFADAGHLRGTESHNLPTIGGIGQRYGPEARAQDMAAELDSGYAMAGLDLSAAYPPEAGVEAWQRTLILTRGGGARLIDAFNLSRPERVEFHFMAAQAPSIGEGRLRVGSLRMSWDGPLIARSEPAPQGEAGVAWSRMHRIALETPEPVTEGRYAFSMRGLATFGGEESE